MPLEYFPAFTHGQKVYNPLMRRVLVFLILVIPLFLPGFFPPALIGAGEYLRASAQTVILNEDEPHSEREDSGLRFGPTTLPRTAPVVPATQGDQGESPQRPGADDLSAPQEFIPPEPRTPQRLPTPAQRPSSMPAPPAAEMLSFPSPLECLAQADANKSLDARLDLVRKPVGDRVQQQPAVAVADGETSLYLHFPTLDGSESPNLVLSDLRMQRLSKEEGRWVLEAVPHNDIWEAKVFVIGQGKMWQVPVVVTPLRDIDFDGNGRIDAADYRLFRQGDPFDAQFDLNGDGVRDVIDEFIFLANYLLSTDAQAPGAAQRR
ncbi:hypothetical protein SAMN05660860_01597 [Geoalkalibacter ferrihydriticus]|uniref:EF-hand domain-containing protein n=3 Tax=Geoalkalibacter ferrihydriticus TaxID=392333 RepID=A0A0C2ED15_9BACT|nr:hypothetical protein GFER_09915 [Geoalkalibacter ferrihydriticus DSM 17813]SDL98166.1 hypothetical protein SAMN05660860_01597 [Geoalkalibacter ferrihydriticus]